MTKYCSLENKYKDGVIKAKYGAGIKPLRLSLLKQLPKAIRDFSDDHYFRRWRLEIIKRKISM